MESADQLEILISLWPVFAGFISLVIILAKMHADLETVKEKVRVLFDLWNSKDKK
jgi:hypothetical protein